MVREREREREHQSAPHIEGFHYNFDASETNLSKDGNICTDSLVNVDGDVIGADLLSQSMSSLLSLRGRVNCAHVACREQLPVVYRPLLQYI